MNECYCWTHRDKRQGSHAPPSLTTLDPVKHAARSDSKGTDFRDCGCARASLLVGFYTVPTS